MADMIEQFHDLAVSLEHQSTVADVDLVAMDSEVTLRVMLSDYDEALWDELHTTVDDLARKYDNLATVDLDVRFTSNGGRF